MRSLTPTAPGQRCRTPATPAAETHTPRAAASTSTPAPPSTSNTDILPPPTLSTQHLLAENMALREEVARLRAEMQVVLDHSIESDQRLLQYTDNVFLPPPSMTSASPVSTKSFFQRSIETQTEDQTMAQDLDRALDKIRTLEDELQSLQRPCESCAILKDETEKIIINSLRILERDNKILKGSISKVSHPATNPVSSNTLKLQNSYEVLSESMDHDNAEDGFITVTKRRKRVNRQRHKTRSKTASQPKNLTKKSKKDKEISIPFKSVAVIGDSHVRGLAALVKSRLQAGPVVSGICKPGAGLLDVKPTSASQTDHCYVVMAGTNDVDAGREDVIFNHLEEVLQTCGKSSRVLLLPLPTRHDLHPRSPVHKTNRLANEYAAELCPRHQGVEMLDTSSVRRHHHTAHGLHLNGGGKRHLASLVVERLAHITTLLSTRPRQPLVRQPAPAPAPVTAKSPQAPWTLPHESYAEAVTQ